MFSVPEAMAVLTQFDSMLRNPFDSVQKIFLISQKTKNDKQLIWCLQAVHDMIKARTMEPGELSQRVIKGEGSSGKGIVDLLVLKMEMKVHLLANVLDGLNIGAPGQSQSNNV